MDAGSSLNLGGVEIFVLYFVFFLFTKKPVVSESRVTLLTWVALATLGAVIQVHPVSSRGLWGGRVVRELLVKGV